MFSVFGTPASDQTSELKHAALYDQGRSAQTIASVGQEGQSIEIQGAHMRGPGHLEIQAGHQSSVRILIQHCVFEDVTLEVRGKHTGRS